MLVVPERMRLMRIATRRADLALFQRVASRHWKGASADAFRGIAQRIVSTMTSGGCKSLPRIRRADERFYLPKKRKAKQRTREAFKRFNTQLDRDCAALSKVPHHTTSVRISEIGGSVRTEGKYNVPFKLTLVHDKSGELKIAHLKSAHSQSRQ